MPTTPPPPRQSTADWAAAYNAETAQIAARLNAGLADMNRRSLESIAAAHEERMDAIRLTSIATLEASILRATRSNAHLGCQLSRGWWRPDVHSPLCRCIDECVRLWRLQHELALQGMQADTGLMDLVDEAVAAAGRHRSHFDAIERDARAVRRWTLQAARG